VISPQISGKCKAPFFSLIDYIEHDDGRSDDVSGIEKRNTYLIGDSEWPVVTDPDELIHAVFRILHGVNGLDFGKPFFKMPFIDKFSIFLLNMGRIPQHNVGQILCGVCANNVAFETLFYQLGNIPAVIDVGMGEDECVNRRRIEGKIPIPFVCLLPLSLEQTAFQKYIHSIDR
jgi:hypothetical protein